MAPLNGELLQAIVKSSDEAIYSKDLDGTITSWNPAAEHLYGYSAEEAIGQNVMILAADDARRAEIEDILRRVARGERLAHQITERLTRDGRVIRVSLNISPLREHDSVIGASIIAHEVGVSEAQLAEMRALVSEALAQAASSALVAKRVHDLKNQLVVVAGGLNGISLRLDAFMTSEQTEQRLVTLERRVNRRSWRRIGATVLLLLSLVLVLAFESRSRAIDGCERRNRTNQVIRDITDRSQQSQLDASRLSPPAREIIAEFERAQQEHSQQSFRDFVRSRTPIQDCGGLL